MRKSIQISAIYKLPIIGAILLNDFIQYLIGYLVFLFLFIATTTPPIIAVLILLIDSSANTLTPLPVFDRKKIEKPPISVTYPFKFPEMKPVAIRNRDGKIIRIDSELCMVGQNSIMTFTKSFSEAGGHLALYHLQSPKYNVSQNQICGKQTTQLLITTRELLRPFWTSTGTVDFNSVNIGAFVDYSN